VTSTTEALHALQAAHGDGDAWWDVVTCGLRAIVRRPLCGGAGGRSGGERRRITTGGGPGGGSEAEPAAGTIARMAVTDDRPLADQLAELGAQLAWVRDYL